MILTILGCILIMNVGFESLNPTCEICRDESQGGLCASRFILLVLFLSLFDLFHQLIFVIL